MVTEPSVDTEIKNLSANNKPEKVKFEDLSYDEQRAIIDQKELDDIEKEDIKNIKLIKCKKCKKSLKIDPKIFMESKKNRAIIETCKNCDMQNRIQVKFQQDINGLIHANISQNLRGYSWVENAPFKFSDDELRKWVAEENGKILDNKSSFQRREEQILVRALNLALNGK